MLGRFVGKREAALMFHVIVGTLRIHIEQA